MQILHLCPANVATGGTESIHNLVRQLNECGADAKILYIGKDLKYPQPVEYLKYGCPYITEYPIGFGGLVIFPEIWGNQVLNAKYNNCKVAIHWQGVDVYYWNNPSDSYNSFLRRKDVIHITNLKYGIEHLRKLGLSPIKVSDVLNDDFFNDFSEEFERNNVVLYNPTQVKLTEFQKQVMNACKDVEFKPLQGFSREELINIMRKSKLYIDFGVFSGRERLPREAVRCGCCILTSNTGAAGYYEDNPIPDIYKVSNHNQAIEMIHYILDNYELCKPDFDTYREALLIDRNNYPNEVREFYNAIFSYNPGV